MGANNKKTWPSGHVKKHRMPTYTHQNLQGDI